MYKVNMIIPYKVVIQVSLYLNFKFNKLLSDFNTKQDAYDQTMSKT